MRKMILGLAVLGALLGSGLAKADPPSNTHGMCTAYFNGSQNGQDHKRQSDAFTQFASYVGDNDGVDNDGDGDVDEGGEIASPVDIWNYCDNAANNPKGIGGQPTNPSDPGSAPGGGKGNGKGGGKP